MKKVDSKIAKKLNSKLVRKLKKAGFPIKNETPTLSELIESCGDDFMLTNEECAYTDKNNIWLAWQGSTNQCVMMGESGAIHQCGGSTPEEAVANLWLKINTK